MNKYDPKSVDVFIGNKKICAKPIECSTEIDYSSNLDEALNLMIKNKQENNEDIVLFNSKDLYFDIIMIPKSRSDIIGGGEAIAHMINSYLKNLGFNKGV